MKTSNILLLGTLAVFLIAITVIIFGMRSYIPDQLEGKEAVLKVERSK